MKLLHFYPDLMSLYGSYANLSLLRRTLERMGNTVTVEPVAPGAEADVDGADFLFMGAGTERSQKAALADFLRFGEAVKAAAARGVPMLFCGTAMELLGTHIIDSDEQAYPGIGLAPFSSVQGTQRFVEDVYGFTDLYEEPIVGFMNKCSVISDVDAPLVTSVALGYGNDGPRSPEGYRKGGVFASQLTGPILVKNPGLLKAVVAAVYAHRGEALPEIPLDEYLTKGYAITAEQLKLRCGK